MQKFLSSLWEFIKIIIIALLIVIPIRLFLAEPFLVKGQSMEPNFSNGDYLIIEKISYRLAPPQRGEVVVFKYPHNPSQRYIKRIIGLPGETVEVKNGKVFIRPKIESPNSAPGIVFSLDESTYLPDSLATFGHAKKDLSENEYFVLGDNRPFSSDSRRWGVLPKQNIVGRALVRLWPIPAFAMVEAPGY